MKYSLQLLLAALGLSLLFTEPARAALIQIRLEVQDTLGNPVTTVTTGQDFKLAAFVDDLRELDAAGVFAAYFDVTYNPTLVQFTSAVTFSPSYSNGQHSDTQTLGVLNEVGAFQTGVNPLGGMERLLFLAPFRAQAVGTADFLTNPSDSPFYEMILAFVNEPVSPAEVNYLGTSVTIVPESAAIWQLALGTIGLAVGRWWKKRQAL